METIGKKYKNKICVITPTIRLEGLDLVRRALEEQTFTDFDWLICSRKDPELIGPLGFQIILRVDCGLLIVPTMPF